MITDISVCSRNSHRMLPGMMMVMMMMMRTNLTTTMSFTTSQLIIQNLAYEPVLLSINLSYDKGFI